MFRSCSPDDPKQCRFGSPISLASGGLRNSFLGGINDDPASSSPRVDPVTSWRVLSDRFLNLPSNATDEELLVQSFIEPSFYENNPFGLETSYFESFNYSLDAMDNERTNEPWDRFFTVRTCNSFWNPQVPIRPTNVDPFYLGMASQATEREDTIITPDLRGKVNFGIPAIMYIHCPE